LIADFTVIFIAFQYRYRYRYWDGCEGELECKGDRTKPSAA